MRAPLACAPFSSVDLATSMLPLARWKTTILGVSPVVFAGLLGSRPLVGPLPNGGATVGPVPAAEAEKHVGKRAEACSTVVDGV